MLIVVIYVDDMIYIGNMQSEEFKLVLKREVEMTSLGLMKYFLGKQVVKSSQGICISCHKYATNILKRLLDKYKPIEAPIAIGKKLSKKDEGPKVNSTLYKSIVSILMYLTTIRLHLLYVVQFHFPYL